VALLRNKNRPAGHWSWPDAGCTGRSHGYLAHPEV